LDRIIRVSIACYKNACYNIRKYNLEIGEKMTWDRHFSQLEKLLVEILGEAGSALTLKEITNKIGEKSPGVFSGETPVNSLYSIIYRREKRREQRGHEPLLRTIRDGHSTKYLLNSVPTNTAGSEITDNE
jgi:hypothetical protein